MKFKEQSFALFAYTNYRATQGYHRLKTLDFKEKGAFHHSLDDREIFMKGIDYSYYYETIDE